VIFGFLSNQQVALHPIDLRARPMGTVMTLYKVIQIFCSYYKPSAFANKKNSLPAASEERSGGGPDTLFQTLSKHAGGNERLFGV
jgi:hypothetical protein